MRLFRRFLESRTGSAAIEFSIVSLLFVVVSVGAVDFGRGIDVRGKMSRSVDIAARKVLLNPALTSTQIQDAVRQGYNGKNPQLLQIQVASETISGTSFKVVTMTYPMPLLVPTFGVSLVNIKVSRRLLS